MNETSANTETLPPVAVPGKERAPQRLSNGAARRTRRQNAKAGLPAKGSNKKRRKAMSRKHDKPRTKLAGAVARDGSKKTNLLDLLKRPQGAALSELMKTADWKAHSVRGFLSGNLHKKMGLTIESTRRKDGERVYRILK